MILNSNHNYNDGKYNYSQGSTVQKDGLNFGPAYIQNYLNYNGKSPTNFYNPAQLYNNNNNYTMFMKIHNQPIQSLPNYNNIIHPIPYPNYNIPFNNKNYHLQEKIEIECICGKPNQIIFSKNDLKQCILCKKYQHKLCIHQAQYITPYVCFNCQFKNNHFYLRWKKTILPAQELIYKKKWEDDPKLLKEGTKNFEFYLNLKELYETFNINTNNNNENNSFYLAFLCLTNNGKPFHLGFPDNINIAINDKKYYNTESKGFKRPLLLALENNKYYVPKRRHLITLDKYEIPNAADFFTDKNNYKQKVTISFANNLENYRGSEFEFVEVRHYLVYIGVFQEIKIPQMSLLRECKSLEEYNQIFKNFYKEKVIKIKWNKIANFVTMENEQLNMNLVSEISNQKIICPVRGLFCQHSEVMDYGECCGYITSNNQVYKCIKCNKPLNIMYIDDMSEKIFNNYKNKNYSQIYYTNNFKFIRGEEINENNSKENKKKNNNNDTNKQMDNEEDESLSESFFKFHENKINMEENMNGMDDNAQENNPNEIIELNSDSESMEIEPNNTNNISPAPAIPASNNNNIDNLEKDNRNDDSNENNNNTNSNNTLSNINYNNSNSSNNNTNTQDNIVIINNLDKSNDDMQSIDNNENNDININKENNKINEENKTNEVIITLIEDEDDITEKDNPDNLNNNVHGNNNNINNINTNKDKEKEIVANNNTSSSQINNSFNNIISGTIINGKKSKEKTNEDLSNNNSLTINSQKSLQNWFGVSLSKKSDSSLDEKANEFLEKKRKKNMPKRQRKKGKEKDNEENEIQSPRKRRLLRRIEGSPSLKLKNKNNEKKLRREKEKEKEKEKENNDKNIVGQIALNSNLNRLDNDISNNSKSNSNESFNNDNYVNVSNSNQINNNSKKITISKLAKNKTEIKNKRRNSELTSSSNSYNTQNNNEFNDYDNIINNKESIPNKNQRRRKKKLVENETKEKNKDKNNKYNNNALTIASQKNIKEKIIKEKNRKENDNEYISLFNPFEEVNVQNNLSQSEENDDEFETIMIDKKDLIEVRPYNEYQEKHKNKIEDEEDEYLNDFDIFENELLNNDQMEFVNYDYYNIQRKLREYCSIKFKDDEIFNGNKAFFNKFK